ncbi:hypothetical protein V2J09_014380 [Rumex salicifolius]
MPFLSTSSLVVGSATNLCFRPQILPTDFPATTTTTGCCSSSYSCPLSFLSVETPIRRRPVCTGRIYASSGAKTDEVLDDSSALPSSPDISRPSRGPADWEAARTFRKTGFVYKGRVEGYNSGGLLIRFYSIVGFMPFPHLSPTHTCTEPQKHILETAKSMIGSIIPMKVIEVDEEKGDLVFSEREAMWAKYSDKINVGDVFEARIGTVEDYGAFVYLRFPDGLYPLTGLVHVSEVSWDLVQDVRDILHEGDNVRVKVIGIDRLKSRITLSIRQLEEDPLFETIDKVIPQDGPINPYNSGKTDDGVIEPLPGLQDILTELLKENGITGAKIRRQGFERRVVAQDLQLWLSNAPAVNNQFVLLARAGRQVQEIQLTTTLDQEGIKKALQRVLGRIP